MNIVEIERSLLLENAAEKAINLAEHSALHNGMDIPVGAVALFGAAMTGKGYARDGETGNRHLHAEIVAIKDALEVKEGRRMPPPSTIVTTMEPCEICQDHMAGVESITTVAFVTPRSELSDRGLVNARPSIEERVARYELPYRVVRLDNTELNKRALEPLEFTTRDTLSGKTTVDSDAFRRHLFARTQNNAD